MDDWLQSLGADAASAANRSELSAIAVSHMRSIFGVRIAGVLLLEGKDCVASAHTGIRATYVEQYVHAWKAQDWVLRAALARRTPARDSDVGSFSDARAVEPICAALGRPLAIISYMVAPLYGSDCTITGTLHMCRSERERPFDDASLRQAFAFSGFLSVMFARVEMNRTLPGWELAPREYQVAALAVRGLSNAAIASDLGLARETVKQTLRRVYRKTGLSTRIALASAWTMSGLG